MIENSSSELNKNKVDMGPDRRKEDFIKYQKMSKRKREKILELGFYDGDSSDDEDFDDGVIELVGKGKKRGAKNVDSD